MPEFLSLVTPEEALDLLFRRLKVTRTFEIVSTERALGKVTSEDICSPQDLPDFRRSTVDGYAVLARDTHGASEGLPAYLQLVGEIPMGQEPGFPITNSQCGLIHTGGMLPDGANAVVMLEDTQLLKNGEIEIYNPAAPGDNLIEIGEDIKEGSVVIPKGTRLRPAEIGGLMALGITEVGIVKPPLFGVISSGDEVIPPDLKPRLGQVRDINSYTLGTLIEDFGARVHHYGIIPDSRKALSGVIAKALEECDHLIVTAGSSASARDLTAEVMNELGDPGVFVHGLHIKPGKPTILALAERKLMIGLPGNPVSALVIAQVMIKPILAYLLGLDKPRPQPVIEAQITVNIASQAGREDWIPVRLIERQPGVWKAEPVFGRSNLIFVLARADGLVRIPPAVTGLEPGAIVSVQLMG
jgi:molybdopterin molybdotransferase